MNITYTPVGVFHSPFDDIKEMPIQPVGGMEYEGKIEIFPEFSEGLMDLEGFSHIIVLSHLHQIKDFELKVKPFLDDTDHGIFATRSPKRPNPIGLSIMQITKVSSRAIYVKGIDVVHGTPVLDIKPYVPEFDAWETERVGWFEGKSERARHHRSDDRFA